MIDAIPALRGYVDRKIAELEQRLVARMEALPPRYHGPWREGRYCRGTLVTCGGSLWHANADTDTKPGKSAEWQLAVKKGRDGKDSNELRRIRAPRG